MAQKSLEGRVSNSQGRHAYPGLSPAFFGLMESASLSAPFALEATQHFQKVIDRDAERMQHNRQMSKRFCDELIAGNGFSSESINWSFAQLTGIIIPEKTSSNDKQSAKQAALSTGVTVFSNSERTKETKTEPKLLFDGAASADDLFYGWKLEGESALQKMIAQAAKDPEACLLGGGLPPTALILEFFEKIYLPAIKKMKSWSKEKKVELLQYPKAGGALSHRKTVVDHFLSSKERKAIINNFGKENRADGLFFTNGSQEALSMMIEMLVSQGKATKRNPIELAVTDPTYPGLLMAADKFLQQGVLKLRIVPIDEKTGKIDTKALDTALSDPKGRCNAFYLAEGNPLPKQIANLNEVAKILKKSKHKNKIVFDDHAYDGLGATEKNSLFELLPNQVVSFKTLSKKAAPFRVGFVYSNMSPERFQYIRETMLKNQYDSKLGFSGVLSGTVAAILELDVETAKKSGARVGVFKEHIKKAKAHYETQRKLYAATYKQALDLAFGKNKYNLDDEVVIGKKMFMFGWRNTHHVPADLYTRAGAEIKLYSLSGNSSRPNKKYIRGERYSNSPTKNHLRQNYTWIKPENLQIGIYKDVLLQVVFSKKMSSEERREAVERIYRRILELNGNKLLKEVDDFIDKVSANHWKYPKPNKLNS